MMAVTRQLEELVRNPDRLERLEVALAVDCAHVPDGAPRATFRVGLAFSATPNVTNVTTSHIITNLPPMRPGLNRTSWTAN